MNKPPAQTVIRWLRENGIPLGALTHHDTRALLAAVQVAELWVAGDGDNRELSAAAFKNVVEQMQPQTRYMAFHGIAHVGDWSHRWQLWHHALLDKEALLHVPECKFGPRRAEQPAAA